MSPEINWRGIRMVGFDVDGTLYAQGPLRRRMALELLQHAAQARSLDQIRILSAYRKIREHVAEEERENFEEDLIARTASATGASRATIKACVCEWIETRPLRHLRRVRRAGVAELIQRLRGRGLSIGVVSDYPAHDKLSALDLTGDIVISATDPDIGRLKPHPAGLRALIARANIRPDELLYIGDRPERDGEAARRAGAHVLILGSGHAGWPVIGGFDDPVFREITVHHD